MSTTVSSLSTVSNGNHKAALSVSQDFILGIKMERNSSGERLKGKCSGLRILPVLVSKWSNL